MISTGKCLPGYVNTLCKTKSPHHPFIYLLEVIWFDAIAPFFSCMHVIISWNIFFLINRVFLFCFCCCCLLVFYFSLFQTRTYHFSPEFLEFIGETLMYIWITQSSPTLFIVIHIPMVKKWNNLNPNARKVTSTTIFF